MYDIQIEVKGAGEGRVHIEEYDQHTLNACRETLKHK